jgi:hypothetical protein
VDDIFLTQLWSGNQAMYARLKKDTTPLGKARLDYFWLNKGPWSDLDDYAAFLPGAPPRKLPGANFYPEDMPARNSKLGRRRCRKPRAARPKASSP